jgi:hypothetical protein
VVEHWDGTSWSIVPSPNPNGINPIHGSRLNGIAAISANDIWAVGTNEDATLTEHWDGTRWRVINSPSPGQSNSLSGVTALSDGTVAAVGFQFSSTTGTTPLILQNATSAHKSATTASLVETTLAAPLDTAPVMLAGTTTVAQTRPTPARLDAAPVDQFLAAVGRTDQQLWLAYYSLRPRHTAVNANWDDFSGDMWLTDQN